MLDQGVLAKARAAIAAIGTPAARAVAGMLGFFDRYHVGRTVVDRWRLTERPARLPMSATRTCPADHIRQF